MSQFADSSSSNEPIEAASRSPTRFGPAADGGQEVAIEIAGRELVGPEMVTHEVLSDLASSTIYSQSNGNPPNLSCAIDIGPTEEASESEKQLP